MTTRQSHRAIRIDAPLSEKDWEIIDKIPFPGSRKRVLEELKATNNQPLTFAEVAKIVGRDHFGKSSLQGFNMRFGRKHPYRLWPVEKGSASIRLYKVDIKIGGPFITEEELRQHIEEVEQDPKRTVFNNFHAHFPGGSYRARSIRDIERYLTGDHRMTPKAILEVHEDLKLWVEIDRKIIELGYTLDEVWEWEHYGELESDHKDLMISVFVHLVNQGYDRRTLIS